MDKPPTDILLLIGGSTVGINAFLRYLLWCDVIVLSCGMTSLQLCYVMLSVVSGLFPRTKTRSIKFETVTPITVTKAV